MSGPPAVSHPVGRSSGLLLLLGGLWLPGALAAALFLSPALEGELRWPALGVLLLSLLGGALALLAFWWRQRPGLLSWDGAQWSWHEASAARPLTALRLQVRLDLQRALLLRVRGPHAASGWLWVQQGADPGRWHLLRCALYFEVSPEAADRPGQPPAPAA